MFDSRGQEYEHLREKLHQTMPDNPACMGWKAFSQNDEDGIIQECLRRIASHTPLSKTFIEIGCGEGLENNTHQLLLNGFRGIWIDGAEYHVQLIAQALGGLQFPRLAVLQRFITLETLQNLLSDCMTAIDSLDLDVFSLDVDGNDLYFAQVIAKVVQPKILVVEYNAKFPPPNSLSIEYNPTHACCTDDYQGASLQAFVNVLPNYRLVSCCVAGVNAFFVREDLSQLFTCYPVAQLYQPARFWLTGYQVSHKPSYKWLVAALNKAD